jgi:hypothetical protein
MMGIARAQSIVWQPMILAERTQCGEGRAAATKEMMGFARAQPILRDSAYPPRRQPGGTSRSGTCSGE